MARLNDCPNNPIPASLLSFVCDEPKDLPVQAVFIKAVEWDVSADGGKVGGAQWDARGGMLDCC